MPAADSIHVARNGITPDEWAQSLLGPARYASSAAIWPTATLKYWVGTNAVMEQPPLDHHYIVQHLGGSKHVQRRCDGASISTVVDEGSLTLVPAGTQFKWHTRGPIEFAHIYICPELLARTAQRFDRVNEITLLDKVGCHDPILEALYRAMLEEVYAPRNATRLYLDSLLQTFLIKLCLDHTSAHIRSTKIRETLSSFRASRLYRSPSARLDRACRSSRRGGRQLISFLSSIQEQRRRVAVQVSAAAPNEGGAASIAEH